MAFPAQAFLSAAIRARLAAADDAAWNAGAVYADHARPKVLGADDVWIIVSPPVVEDELVTPQRQNVAAIAEVLVSTSKSSTDELAQASAQVVRELDKTGLYDVGSKERLVLGSGASQAARDSWKITSMWWQRESGVEVTREKGRRFYVRVLRFSARMEAAAPYA